MFERDPPRLFGQTGKTLLFLTKAAEDFAAATVPGEVFRTFMSATTTVLERVRGTATGTVFRRCGCQDPPQTVWQRG